MSAREVGHGHGGATVVHRAPRHGVVVQPVGGDVHQVDVLAPAQLLVSLRAAVDGGVGHPGLAQELLALLGAAALVVAQGHDLRAGNVGEAAHGPVAPHAQAHEAHAHHLQPRGRQPQHVLLPLGAGRRLHHDGSAVPVPACPLVGGVHRRLVLHRAGGQGHAQPCRQHQSQLSQCLFHFSSDVCLCLCLCMRARRGGAAPRRAVQSNENISR